MKKKKQDNAVPAQIPKQVESVQLLMQAIKLDNPNAMRILVGKALDAIYASTTPYTEVTSWNDTDLDAIIDMVRGVNPHDFIECVLACQIIVYHLHAMAALAANYNNNKLHAVAMTKICHQSMDRLHIYREKARSIDTSIER